MSFYTDAIGDMEFVRGNLVIDIYANVYNEGSSEKALIKTININIDKSIQPLDPEEIMKYGFGEYGADEIYSLITLTKLPVPDSKQEYCIIKDGLKEFTILKVVAWEWNSEPGYYEYIITRKADKLNMIR